MRANVLWCEGGKLRYSLVAQSGKMRHKGVILVVQKEFLWRTGKTAVDRWNSCGTKGEGGSLLYTRAILVVQMGKLRYACEILVMQTGKIAVYRRNSCGAKEENCSRHGRFLCAREEICCAQWQFSWCKGGKLR